MGDEEANAPAAKNSILGLNDTQFPLFITMVAGIILIVATGNENIWMIRKYMDYPAYQLSISVIAMALSFFALVLSTVAEQAYAAISKPILIFLFVYSFVGACFLTFYGPFFNSGNGYFSVWIIVYGSGTALGITAEMLKSKIQGLSTFLGLLAASLVVLIATSMYIRDGVEANREEAIYGLSVACATICYLLVVMTLDRLNGSKPMSGTIYFVVTGFLAVCWIVEAFITTFRGPFRYPFIGNGYYASWAAAILSTYLAFQAVDKDISVLTLDDTQFPLFITMVAGIILIVATGNEHIWNIREYMDYPAYQLSISVIAMALSFFALVLSKFAASVYAAVSKPLLILLFVYSFVGACFLTFYGPFFYSGNGYFSVWIIVYGSASAMGITAEVLKSNIKGLSTLVGLLAASVVVVIATAAPIRDKLANREEAIYALSVACASIFYTLVVFHLDRENGTKPMSGIVYFLFTSFLAGCWIVEAFITTFRGPFVGAGNGYYASWAAASLSTYLAMKTLSDD